MSSSSFKPTTFRPPGSLSASPLPELVRGRPNGHYNAIGTLETSTDQLVLQQKNIEKQFKSNALDQLAKEEYQPAIYAKAVKYRNERSYRKKIDGEYTDIELLADTNELRYFGLGPYFYIEFFRRVCWLVFFMTLVQAITIYINYKGVGLDNYSVSYFSYLIKASLGNYSGSVMTDSSDGYLVCLAPAVNYLAMFFFYLIWKVHYFRTITTQEEDNKDVKPEKFCVEINGLSEQYVDQSELQRFFTAFGPVYEVSVVRNYENQLQYFKELDHMEEEIKEEELQLILGGDDSNRKEIARKKQEKLQLEKKLHDMHIKPTTVSVYVHFQFEKSKVECLTYFNQRYLFDTCPHSCTRNCCCCCITKPDERAIFKDQVLTVATENPPTPSDINWEHFEISSRSKVVRVLFAIFIIILFLALTTTIVGVCGIYISSHSNDCDGIDTSTYTATTAAATGNSTILRCYCNANLVASFTDDQIASTCSDYLRDIYVQQAIQYAVLITEIITNILFGIVVDKLVNCVRPESKASALFTKTLLLTIFLVINTVLVPILIYADIFGFEPTRYVSFLTLISSDIKNFLLVDNLSFYPEFNAIWYRNVSPIFTNFLIFNTLGVWGSYLFFRCCCSSHDSLQDDERKMLQKTMNRKINSFQIDIVKEASNAYLVLIMAALFCAGIPALVPIALVNLVSRYLINRSLLQSYSSQVEGLGEGFSSITLIMFPVVLIFFPLIGEWMLISNNYIYPNGLPSDLSFLNFLEGHSDVLDKQAFLPFYLLISFLAFGELVIYNSIIRFCSCLCNLCYEKKEVNYHSRPFSEYKKSINILCSYNIRNNDQMRNAILHLEKYLITKE